MCGQSWEEENKFKNRRHFKKMRVTDTHVFFWGEWFSNWYDCIVEYKDHTFDNSEQAFMWEKAKFFGDHEIAKKILMFSNPSKAKKLGRQVKNFDAEKWRDPGYRFMVDINFAKFNQNEFLKRHLLETGDKTIVEASPYDKIWGIGLREDDDRVLDEDNWDGLNLLGKALMEVREILKGKKI